VTLTGSDAFQYSFEKQEAEKDVVCSVFTRAVVEGIETGNADEDGLFCTPTESEVRELMG
jgi:hypothetical protein